jgi:hypothetical protein
MRPSFTTGDPVRQDERRVLVVRHEHEGDPHLLLQLLQLHLHRVAQPRVERRERLVEQQHLRPANERARQGHPLPLAARELVRPPLLQPADLHELDPLRHARRPLALRHAEHLQPERHVLSTER